MKYFYIILCVISMYHTAYSQSKEELENWLNVVETEFSEFDRTNSNSLPRSGSVKYNQIRFNLLSDKYFIPVFGKSILELSKSKKKSIQVKISVLERKKTMVSQELKNPWAKRLNWYLRGALTEERLFEQITQQVKNMNALRLQYRQQVKQIEQSNIDFNTLAYEAKNIDRKYVTLLPSEIKNIKLLIEKQTASIANESILKNMEELKNFPVNYNALMKLHNFKNKNKQILSSADLTIKNQVEHTIDDAFNTMLTQIVNEEKKNISTLSITALNSFSDNFSQKFGTFSNTSQVKQMQTEISNLKAQKVTERLNIIENSIQYSESNASLQNIENTYLSHINLNKYPNIASLSQKITWRKKELVEEQRLLLEEQKKARKQAEIANLEKFGFKFSTEGLQNAKLIDDIFKGNFKDIPFNRDDLKLSTLVTQYMYANAKTCAAQSRENNVEILEDYCDDPWEVRDGYGNFVRDECRHWIKVKTGLFTSKSLYEAHAKVESLQKGNTLQTLGRMLLKPNEVLPNMINDIIPIKSDIIKLVTINSCDNAALQRFEENLVNFTFNRAAVRLDGTSVKTEIDYSQKQDINRLFKDLVIANSKEWSGTYVQGSLTNISIVSRDLNNRPLKISANYKFNGFGVQTDQVVIRFENGVPKCIDFPNYQMYCKTPDRRVVANFVDGAYVMN